jgi:hypothetical protein
MPAVDEHAMRKSIRVTLPILTFIDAVSAQCTSAEYVAGATEGCE